MAVTLALAAGFIAVLMLYRRRGPVQGFSIMVEDGPNERLASTGVQILDIRDPIDFESEHHSDAINIYIGRLPYVSKKELRRDQEVVIVSTSKAHIRRAAKILQNEGFTGLTGVVCRSRGHGGQASNHRQISEVS